MYSNVIAGRSLFFLFFPLGRIGLGDHGYSWSGVIKGPGNKRLQEIDRINHIF